jgi:small-conductance mechanosensitive channel
LYHSFQPKLQSFLCSRHLTKQMHAIPYPVPVIGTAAVLVVGWLGLWIGHRLLRSRERDSKERYRSVRLLNTIVVVVGLAILIALWSRLFQHTGTFLGLIGAGLAVALREPLLSLAGRVAIFMGRIYNIDDRIEINKLSGDVIDIGLFYTRMMEIGNWIGGDQYSGRIIQFANAQIFGTPVFNYTRNFAYIWDEIKLPVTYESNVKAATELLKKVGGDYSRTFMEGAEQQVKKMQKIFMVPNFELEPSVFMKVTDNWVELTLRYLVDPHKRRNASTFIFREVFSGIKQRNDIQIASSTMTLTIQRSELEEKIGKEPEQEAA